MIVASINETVDPKLQEELGEATVLLFVAILASDHVAAYRNLL